MEQQFSDLHTLLQVYDPDFCSYLDRNESSQMSFTFRSAANEHVGTESLRLPDHAAVWRIETRGQRS